MGELRAALDVTLAALDLAPRDEALAELARQLADEIDQAATVERVADKALRLAERDDQPELEDLIRSLRAKAGHRDAIVRVGQRLEAALVHLGATPAARGKAGPALPLNGPLAVLRGGAAG
jgi:hypothetical protein